MNEENNTEDKVARQGRSDIATMRETKDLSTKLSLVQRKVDGIGRVVFEGKHKMQKIAQDVNVMRRDNVGNTKLMLELSGTKDRLDSLVNVILKMHDTLESIKESQERMHLEVFGYTSPRAEALDSSSGTATAELICVKHYPPMQDHIKKMERKFANSSREPGMSIKTFARAMTNIHQEIDNYGGNSSQAILKQNFIKGLGREFDQVYMDLIHETLPTEWKPLDLDKLVPVADNYLRENCQYASRKRKYSVSNEDSD